MTGLTAIEEDKQEIVGHVYAPLTNKEEQAMDNNRKQPKGVTLREDGYYVGRFQYKGEKYPPIFGKNRKEVENKLETLRYEVKNQMYIKESKVTVEEWFKTWLEVYRNNRVSLGTLDSYTNTFNSHIKPVLGNKRVASVSVTQIQQLYNNMAKKGYAHGTIKLTASVLYGMFEQAKIVDMVKKNVVSLATMPRGKEPKERIALTLEEQKQFMNSIKTNSEYYRLFLFALFTGMRNGEVRGLCWSDVDFENKVIHVTGTLKYIKDVGHYKGKTKSITSKRDIPMLEICYDLLKEQKQKQEEQKKQAEEFWNPIKGLEDLVFTDNSGRLVSKERVTKELNDTLVLMKEEEKINIPHFTFHTLRHTFATRGLENGIPLKVMQVILGHKTLAMTADLYSHVLPETKEKEMQKMNATFENLTLEQMI